MAVTTLIVAILLPAQAQSLYAPERYQALTADRKAYRVGDAVTVIIQESAAATSSADTATSRGNAVGAHLDSPFNSRFIVGSRTGNFRTSSDFDGNGKTQRSGKLLAQMTAVVTEVRPDGALMVSGEQLVEINNERQQITVEGIARSQDINEHNAILSYRLAAAKISYVGAGDVASTQRPSWWMRLLNAFGL